MSRAHIVTEGKGSSSGLFSSSRVRSAAFLAHASCREGGGELLLPKVGGTSAIKTLARCLSCATAVLLAALTLGTGIAWGDPLVGLKYSDAAGKIAGWNGKAVVATVSGDQLELDDCVVTSWQRSIFLDSTGTNGRKNEFRLHLNCNNGVAAPGKPGNSLSSEAGAKAKKEQQAAANINKHPEYCSKSEAVAQWCANICKRTGLCEI